MARLAGKGDQFRRDALRRQKFVEQGATNPLSPDDWAASLVATEASTFLQVGAGWGSFALRFLELRGDSVKRYLATESDEEACRVLEMTLAQRAPVVSVARADLSDLSAFREQFDSAIALDALHEETDPAAALPELLGTLRPGGFAVVVTPHRDDLAELWTLVRTFDPSFPAGVRHSRFDSESAPPVLDALDRPWECFDYENVLEVTPDSAVEFVESHFGLFGIERDADWTRGLSRFLAGWSGEFFWAVQRRAGFVVA
jgi:SAM-dependent methyltransferase